ncbi:hypothetical protein L4A40_27000 [Bacillus cereus]|uniref:hypothetical protein n=1 Tax=Bacillus cereus TaxID=1396 RepID=UPI001F0D9666|nr:hypothetical protein [Bacillus cereus]MCH5476736.1 hypothetical protein [Bacillus cereus]
MDEERRDNNDYNTKEVLYMNTNEIKYFAIFDHGTVGIDTIVISPDQESAERFYDNMFVARTSLAKKYGCTAAQITRDNVNRAVGVGAKVYDLNKFEKVAK